MSYSTAIMEPRDRPMVVGLWRENLQGIGASPQLDSRLDWLYEQSPEGAPVTVLATHPSEPAPVGCASVLPRHIMVRNVQVRAGIPIDFAVSRRHRTGAAAMMLQRRLAAMVDSGQFAFLIGYPNKGALPILLRIGYKRICDAPAWVKPLRARYKLRPLLRNRLLADIVSLPADGLLAAIDRFRRPAPRDVGRETIESADARFDALWRQSAGSFPITTVRTSAYLNWRYAQFKTMSYKIYCVTEPPSGALTGYVAYSTNGSNTYIADLFAGTTAHAFDTVMPSFCAQMRREGADTVFFRYVGTEEVAERLRRLGFYLRPENTRTLVAYVGEGVERDFVMQPSNWFSTDGEMDI